jgi:hypothetical protein
MVQLLNILQMPSPLLELADRYRLPERVLREILALPRTQWESMLRSAAQNNLTSDEVIEVAARAAQGEKNPRPTFHPEPARSAASSLRRFAVTLGELDEIGQAQALDAIADTLVATHQAEGVMVLLSELSRLVSARLAGLR